MSNAQAPRRLHYAWVVVLAFVLLLAGLACLWIQPTAGPGYGIGSFVLFMTCLIAPFLGVVLAIWLWVTWGIFSECRPRLARTWVALLPSLIFFGYGTSSIVTDPPSPQRHFQRVFHAELPADARQIDATPPTLADSGHVNFAFRCSKQSAVALIKELALKPVDHWDAGKWIFPRTTRDWSAQDWEKSLTFVRADRTGTGYILVTDALMQHVLVARHPGWAKSAEELTGKAE